MAFRCIGCSLEREISMPTIKYRISSRVHRGQAEVLARFYDNTVQQRAKTHITVPADSWDSINEQVIIPRRNTPDTVALREAQRQLDELMDFVYNAWWRDRFDSVDDNWFQRMIDEFHNLPKSDDPKPPARIRMVDLVMEYAQSKDLAPRSIDQYQVIASALERYEKHAKVILYTDSFTATDVDNFVQFYQMNEGAIRSRNTIAARLKSLSAVCRYAVSKGYMTDTPFGDGKYKIKREVYGDPVYLTIAERNYLYEFDGLPTRLAMQRDIFIFQCHIGCRVSDLLELTNDNITADGFLQYIQHKLRKTKPIVVRVPLSDTALEIIARYKNKQLNGRLLPFVNSQQYNEDIHEIVRLSGLNRIVMVQDPKTLQTVPKQLWEVASSHIARRTFMANVFKETKSERITSAFTGHVDGSRAFSRYTQVDDDIKLEVLKNMKERN